MNTIGYYFSKLKSKLFKSHEIMLNYYRKRGVTIGEKCLICSNVLTKEPFLIEIGDKVTISTNVAFVTHDNSAKYIFGEKGDLFGKIIIGDNCFIGENATLLYDITLGNNIMVAAGAVVTKSFDKSGIIIAGNPARVIGDWETYQKKYEHNAVKRSKLTELMNGDNSVLVKR